MDLDGTVLIAGANLLTALSVVYASSQLKTIVKEASELRRIAENVREERGTEAEQ